MFECLLSEWCLDLWDMLSLSSPPSAAAVDSVTSSSSGTKRKRDIDAMPVDVHPRQNMRAEHDARVVYLQPEPMFGR